MGQAHQLETASNPQGMGRRELLQAGATLAAAGLVAVACSRSQPSSHKGTAEAKPTPKARPDPELQGMAMSDDPQLRLLAQYERRLGFKVDGMMLFTPMPRDAQDAQALAGIMAGTLTEWSRYNAKPLVVMEPTTNGGTTNMDLTTFRDGPQHQAASEYFANLKQLGITDEQMGRWVVFPEPNDPGWADNVTNPGLFSQNTASLAIVIKTPFPNAHVGILLDSQTARRADYSDATMSPGALLPYVQDLPHGLIDSYGLQGFPWGNSDKPANYLNSTSAILPARMLGADHVLINTGSYSRSFDPNLSTPQIVTANAAIRGRDLLGELQTAQAAKAAGHEVTINVFAQDVLNGTPGTADDSYRTESDFDALRACLQQAQTSGIETSLFVAPRS